jgi:hypothetical protein
MAAIITEKFRQHNADVFKDSFSSTTFYLFIGKSSPFSSATSGGSDQSPPTPVDDVTREFYNWDSMLGAKIISTSDVAFVIPRRDWANNTIYDMYEHDVSVSNPATSGATNLWESNFYFVTSENKVYKVLDNNGGAAYSGSEPTFETTAPVLSGGYILQYMYTLTTTEINKFKTTDFIPVSTNSTVSGDAVDGSIDALRITTGSGYVDVAPNSGIYYAAIDGDGTGGIVKLNIGSGGIADYGQGAASTEIFAAGSGYTYGTVDLTDVYTASDLSGTSYDITNGGVGTGGVCAPIISPKGGHGFNAPVELGGHYVMVNAKLEADEGSDITAANDFREVGLLIDPYNVGTTTVASASTVRQSYAIKFASAPGTDFEIDEKITQSSTGAVGRVVEWDATNNILYYLQERWNEYGSVGDKYIAFSGNNAVTGASSGAVATPDTSSSPTVVLSNGSITFASGYASPELESNSGNIIYIENRRPISRATDQTEDIKIVVEF